MKKKKIIFQSDSCLAKTGFGRSAKEILFYLYKTGKYDIVEFCVNKPWSADPEHKRKPWKSFGTMPDNQMELQAIAPDEPRQRLVGYGSHYLDRIIYQEKPDVYIAVQDIWGIDFAVDKPWFSKITSVLWPTLDSLPLIQSATAIAPKVKNYWVWSKFAEDAMKKLGHNHVRTVHGAFDTTKFYRLKDKERTALRQKFTIPLDSFIAGFVFRNQPRKSVPQLLAGYTLFKKNHPEVKKSHLLLHTCWREGWRIHDLADEYKIPHSEILTTYTCKQCRSYFVMPFLGEGVKCPYCQTKDGLITTHPSLGVSEEQLNEIYNLMDVYIHPFNSGGQEMPIQEAKLTELVTLVTNYSCGEEMCLKEACSLPLDWEEYREPDSQFIKATTKASSISKQLWKAYKMSPKQKEEMGKEARQWVISNFSKESVGSFLEKFIDFAPYACSEAGSDQTNPDPFALLEVKPNPFIEVNSQLPNEEWIIELYDKILDRKIDRFDSGFRQWILQLKRGETRAKIESFFRQQAVEWRTQEKKKRLFDGLKDKKEKRLLFVIPASERDIFISTALFRSIKEQYPDYKFFVATDLKYREILNGNPYVDEVISYYPEMDNLIFLEGNSQHDGFFDIAFLPYVHTQRNITYIHGGKTNIAYKDCIKYEYPS